MPISVPVSFGGLRLSPWGQRSPILGERLLIMINDALLASRPATLKKGSATRFGFIPVAGENYRSIDGHIAGVYAYAQGSRYKTLSPKISRLTDVDYPEPPMRGGSVFVLNSKGDLAIQRHSNNYLYPDRVMERLQIAIRERYSDEWQAIVEPKRIGFGTTFVLDQVATFKVLSEIRISNLRQANPHPRSELLRRAYTMRVDTIDEISHHPDGIDRQSEEFQDQIEHAKNYGQVTSVRGTDLDAIQEVSIEEGEVVIRMSSDSDNPPDVAVALSRALQTVRSLFDGVHAKSDGDKEREQKDE
jgi:hypothetical protein